MTWNSVWPDGTVSVSTNRTTGNQNTTYIETTFGNTAADLAYTTAQQDHFFNVGANYDGRHRFIKSPAYTVSGSPADPGGSGLGTSMDGILYLKSTNSQAQWFHRNTSKIYQVTPTLLTGTVAVPTTSYVTVVAVPANVFGEIFMYTTALGEVSCQTGYFRSNGTTVESWAVSFFKQSGTSGTIALKFANGSQASGLNIRARRGDAASATWNYRVTYRAL